MLWIGRLCEISFQFSSSVAFLWAYGFVGVCRVPLPLVYYSFPVPDRMPERLSLRYTDYTVMIVSGENDIHGAT